MGAASLPHVEDSLAADVPFRTPGSFLLVFLRVPRALGKWLLIYHLGLSPVGGVWYTSLCMFFFAL